MFATRNNTDDGKPTNEPFHYTLACRWVGEEMDPYPAQGKISEGKPDAQTALQNTLTHIYRKKKRSQERRKDLNSKRQRLRDYYDEEDIPDIILRMARKLQRQRPKPHGLCVAIPTYIFLVLALKTLILPMLHVVPGGKTWVLPALHRMNERVVMVMSFLVGQLMRILPWITRRPKQYILL
jgi:hypothetical protein